MGRNPSETQKMYQVVDRSCIFLEQEDEWFVRQAETESHPASDSEALLAYLLAALSVLALAVVVFT